MKESSLLTTFNTWFGRYRWKRLPFDISSAPEEFQRHVVDLLDGLEGVETIADDILVYGTGDTLEEAVKNHDDNILTLLERCRERKFKMNKSKFRFKMNVVTYHRHVISDTGLKADPSKVQAMVEMERPEDAKAVKRLLGMVNYLAKFCPHLSTVSEPLRNLTVDGVPFIWSESHITSHIML